MQCIWASVACPCSARVMFARFTLIEARPKLRHCQTAMTNQDPSRHITDEAPQRTHLYKV